MSKTIEKEPVQKHTLNLYEGDFEAVQRMHPEIGASVVIRRLVRRYIKDMTPVVEAPKEAVRL